jgi:hypothetical protein
VRKHREGSRGRINTLPFSLFIGTPVSRFIFPDTEGLENWLVALQRPSLSSIEAMGDTPMHRCNEKKQSLEILFLFIPRYMMY